MKVLISVTDEIHLTEIREEDKDSYLNYYNDVEIHKNFLTELLPYDENKFADWIKIIEETTKKQGSVIQFAIRQKDVGFIGQFVFADFTVGKSYEAQCAYWLARPYRGRGIMPMVLKRMTTYAFRQFGLKRIYAYVFLNNISSEKVLLKAGFMIEGVLRKKFKKNEEFIDIKLFSIVDD